MELTFCENQNKYFRNITKIIKNKKKKKNDSLDVTEMHSHVGDSYIGVVLDLLAKLYNLSWTTLHWLSKVSKK